jgi:hypothetical protein
MSSDTSKTFEEKFCEAHGCSSADFSRKLFWKCLHRHAIPLAPFILLFNSDYFTPDRELITELRRVRKMNDVWEEVRQYFINPRHRNWWRSKANIRISARRLIELARDYLPPGGSPSAPPPKY